MRRSSIVPALVLGLLTVLTAGAVALGLLLAPATPDLTVHNGAGETLLAPSLTAYYGLSSPRATFRIVYQAPDQLTETLLAAGPGSRPVRSVTVKGSQAAKGLQPFDQLQRITGFTPVGSRFVAHQRASTLVAPSEATEVSGTVVYTATVSGGYVVGLTESFRVTTPSGVESGVDHYRIVRIGGQPVTPQRG
jgi:hypothetical protein